ncbi:MAG: helix-turn-helix domain-containing protein [Acidimicrobiia bacterium]
MISARLIKEARMRAGLTQSELASRAGKAASMIGRWERGEVLPPLETTIALIRSTGLELSVVIAAGDDHDLALIKRSLALLPAERLAELVRATTAFDSMAAAAHG